MAVYNEILVGRFNRALQKFLQLKGGPPAASLATEITPHILINTALSSENRWLQSEEMFGAFANQPAVLGNLSQVRLRNPSGSNIAAIISKLSVPINSAQGPYPLQFGQPGLNDLPTILTTRALDSRTTRASILILSAGSTAGGTIIGTVIDQAQAIASGQYEFVIDDNSELILLPGDEFQVQNNTANNSLQVSFRWRERFLEESELRGA